uniref:hypothetical protein n=1 Tax=Flavobacterium sp. TaxID=239 RepID=UPI00404A7F1D
MENKFYAFIIFFGLIACKHHSSTDIIATKSDTLNSNATMIDEQISKNERFSIKNLSDIISNRSVWAEKKDGRFSLAFYFQDKDTISVLYSFECWLMFPYKIDDDKITIFWDINTDSKYDNFDVLVAMNKIEKKYIGQPFMFLEMENDTTLRATYLIKEMISEINKSSKERTLFPEKLNVLNDDDEYY